jgi:hypothetical protein
LLVVSGLVLSLGILLVFVISSSLFPIIGFLGMSLLDGIDKHAMQLKVIGALLIIIIGIYVPLNYLLQHPIGLSGG